jgi:hypothetical protein
VKYVLLIHDVENETAVIHRAGGAIGDAVARRQGVFLAPLGTVARKISAAEEPPTTSH